MLHSAPYPKQAVQTLRYIYQAAREEYYLLLVVVHIGNYGLGVLYGHHARELGCYAYGSAYLIFILLAEHGVDVDIAVVALEVHYCHPATYVKALEYVAPQWPP